MISRKQKCLNPWFGFLIILGVCVVIAVAIFFEFNGGDVSSATRQKQAPKNTGVQVAFPQPLGDADAAVDKFIF